MFIIMKYLVKSIILILFSFLMSCRAYTPTSANEMYSFINKTYSNKESLYYKTLDEAELKNFIKKVDLKLWNNNLSKGLIRGGEVNYNDIFQKEDLILISNKLRNQEQLKLDSNLIKAKDVLTKSKSGGVHQISQPVFNKDQSYSLIFRKKFNGGEDIVIYEVVNNEWKVHSVITLSMI